MKNLIKWICLYYVAKIGLLILSPLGHLYANIKLIAQWDIEKLSNRYKRRAISVDQMGNVNLDELCNDVLIDKEKGHLYGDEDETISQATGENKILKTLNGAGRKFDNFLELFEKNHSIIAVKLQRKKYANYCNNNKSKSK